MAVPIILSSDTAGAPSLTGEDGSLYNLLKWAMPQFGWTTEYDDSANYKIVFRNDALNGTGYYLRIVANSSIHGRNSALPDVKGYTSMSDIDTGLGEFPTSGGMIRTSVGSGSTTRPYFMIGDNKRFWLLINIDSSSNWYRPMYIGDLKPVRSFDEHHFSIITTRTTSTSSGAIMGLPEFYGSLDPTPADSSETVDAVAKSLDGITPSVNASPLTTGLDFGSVYGDCGTEPPQEGLLLAPIYLYTIESPVRLRGQLVGAVNPCHNNMDFEYADGTTFSTVDYDGRTPDFLLKHIELTYSSVSSVERGGLLFDTTSDWDDW